MKTANLFRAIIAGILLTGIQYAYAGVEPMSSGIKTQTYTLEWCAPHTTRVNVSGTCQSGTLANIGGKATITYNGASFPAGGVGANVASLIPTTRTASTLGSAAGTLLSLFNNSTNGAIAIEGEGVVTITATMTDYADNTSLIWVRYKVDKTGPQIVINGMTESSDFTHYESTVGTGATVFKNDSAVNTSNGIQYDNPAIASYAGRNAAVLQNTGHTRTPLHAIYFQNTTTGTGANTPFSIGVTASDSFNGYLAANGAGTSYSGPLVSDLSIMQLRDNAGTADLGTVPLTGDMNTNRLINNVQNGQTRYRLRLYDRSVDRTNAANSGNFSEAAFYAVRDNTAPNLGGNGNSATLAEAYERLLTFPDNDTVYDKTAYTNGYRPESNGVSRMFGAVASMSLGYRLNDTGITGNGVATAGSSATPFDLYNAGINPTSTQLLIENQDNVGLQDVVVNYSQRYENAGTATKNFSRVDNDLVPNNGTYRKYSTTFRTASIPRLCDYVGNCLTPELDFRVAAAPLDAGRSNTSVTPTSVGGDSKMVADGRDYYTLEYALRDIFNNKVVPVVSVENGNSQFKTVNSTVNVLNGLNANQLTSTPSGPKLASARDLELDNSSASTGAINTTGVLTAVENPRYTGGPNGIYSFAIASSVPSKGLYPYLSPNSRLAVQSFVNEATVGAPAGATYPSSGDRIGSFAPMTHSGGSTTSPPVIVVNNGNIGERGGSMDIYVDTALYGRVSVSTGSIAFTSIPSVLMNFEYASPYVYGLINRQALVDGKDSNHWKKLYTTRPSAPVIPYNVYEKNIVAYNTYKDEQPGILNFTYSNTNGTNRQLSNSGSKFSTLLSAPLDTSNLAPGSKSLEFMNTAELRALPLNTCTGSGCEVSLQMSSIPTFGAYDNTKLRVGLASAIAYQIGTNVIQMPSVGRGLIQSNVTKLAVNQFDMSRKYFDDDYIIGDAIDVVNPENAAALTDIAITGLTNQYNAITTDSGATQANAVVEAEISRSTFVTTVKKNVATLTAGFTPTGSKGWCAGANINQSILNGTDASYDKCTIESNGELITFIDGNSTLSCGGTCTVDKRRTLVVRNGSLYIDSDISTRGATGNQTNGQLLLVSMATDGLGNMTIGDAISRTSSDVQGWMFVNTEVTNIDAFLVSQGPVVSFTPNSSPANISTESKVYSKNNTQETQLVNQLHINGSMLALNTIGGGRDTKADGTYTCPYIVDNCNEDTAQYFDLIFMRRYKTIGLSYFTNVAQDNGTLVPFYPDRSINPQTTGAKRSGGLYGTNGTDPNPLNPSQTLRHITDASFQNYPMLIERDTRWNNSPSRLFLTGN